MARDVRRKTRGEIELERSVTENLCTAVTKAGTSCRNHAMEGATTCGMHTPGVARRRVARNASVERLAKGNKLWNPVAPPITDPVAELQMLAGQLKWMFEDLGARVNELRSVVTYSIEGVEQIRAVIGLFERTSVEYHKILVDMTRLGIEERMTVMRERYGDALIEGIRAMINDPQVALNETQRKALAESGQRHLRAALGADNVYRVAGMSEIADTPGVSTEAAVTGRRDDQIPR